MVYAVFKCAEGIVRRIKGAAFFVCVLSGVLGAEPLSLGLEDAAALALDRNPGLRRQIIDLSTAGYKADNLWSLVFPGISAGGGVNYSGAAGYELTARINLSLNAGLPFSAKITRLAYDLQFLGYEDARRQLDIDVAKRFYTLIAARENLANLRGLLALAERQLDLDRVAFANGIKGEIAFLGSRLGAETARYKLSTARTAYAGSLGEFLEFLGLSRDTDVELTGGIEIFPVRVDGDDLVRRYLPGRPDLLRQRGNVENLELVKRRLAFERKAPSLSLQTQWTASRFDPYSDRVSGGVTLSIPIDPWIPGTGNYQDLRSAEAEIEKAKLELRDMEQTAAAQIRSLSAALADSWISVEIARFSLEIARRGYELTEEGFRLGTVSSLALEESRNSLAEKQQELLESELAYKIMTLDLAAAVNIDRRELDSVFGAGMSGDG
jgi:outer membrane protein TolC